MCAFLALADVVWLCLTVSSDSVSGVKYCTTTERRYFEYRCHCRSPTPPRLRLNSRCQLCHSPASYRHCQSYGDHRSVRNSLYRRLVQTSVIKSGPTAWTGTASGRFLRVLDSLINDIPFRNHNRHSTIIIYLLARTLLLEARTRLKKVETSKFGEVAGKEPGRTNLI